MSKRICKCCGKEFYDNLWFHVCHACHEAFDTNDLFRFAVIAQAQRGEGCDRPLERDLERLGEIVNDDKVPF